VQLHGPTYPDLLLPAIAYRLPSRRFIAYLQFLPRFNHSCYRNNSRHFADYRQLPSDTFPMYQPPCRRSLQRGKQLPHRCSCDRAVYLRADKNQRATVGRRFFTRLLPVLWQLFPVISYLSTLPTRFSCAALWEPFWTWTFPELRWRWRLLPGRTRHITFACLIGICTSAPACHLPAASMQLYTGHGHCRMGW